LKKKLVLTLLFVVFLVGALFAGYKVLNTLLDYREEEKTYEDMQQYIHIAETEPAENYETEAPSPENTSPPQQDAEEIPDPHAGIAFPEVDFEALLAVSDDVVGWIYMEDSPINYPVVQGTDNHEYVKKLADGSYNSAGSIFMDYRNTRDLSDRNTIIYGHRMNNGSMFGTVVNYKDQAYYDAHPRCFLMTPEENFVVEFFAGYVAELDEQAWKLSFESDEEFAEWVNEAIAASDFKSDVRPEKGERIITLSTCTRFNGYTRYVLLGVLR